MYGLHFPFPCALAGGLRRMWVGGEERKGMGEVKKGKGQGGGRKDAGGAAGKGANTGGLVVIPDFQKHHVRTQEVRALFNMNSQSLNCILLICLVHQRLPHQFTQYIRSLMPVHIATLMQSSMILRTGCDKRHPSSRSPQFLIRFIFVWSLPVL